MWGSDAAGKVLTEEEKAILLPWTSQDLAIRGGALWIASSYVDIGQNTLYFQKFDVINNEDGLYMHQYAQNIAMAYSESSRYYLAYQSQNMLQSPFVFSIPIYSDMPPHTGHSDGVIEVGRGICIIRIRHFRCGPEKGDQMKYFLYLAAMLTAVFLYRPLFVLGLSAAGTLEVNLSAAADPVKSGDTVAVNVISGTSESYQVRSD
jgi:hypothetical protein